MSIIIIAFPAAPKVDPEAKRKDEELNKLLKQKVTEIILENGEDIHFSAVFQKLIEEGIDDLPPGGGIHSKKIIIEETYNTLLPGKLDTSVEDCPNPLASLLFTNANKAASSSNS
jgi:protein phosphatase 1B